MGSLHCSPKTNGLQSGRARQIDVPEASISLCVVRGLVEAVEQVGVSRDELLRSAQLELTELENEDASVPRSVVYRLCEVALDLTGDPAFGLHWGERLCGTAFNPLSHLVAHAATLRQGFESLHRFHRLLNDQPSFRLSEHGDKVTVQCFHLSGASLRMQRVASEMLVLGVIRLIRSFCPQARVDDVSFDYPTPEYHAEYGRVLELVPRFAQQRTEIVFDRALMNMASLHKDEDVHEALRVIAERRILRLGQHTPFTLRVRDLLVEQGPMQPDMDRIARALGLSKRSLRRRLVSEGSSYKTIVKEALAIVAKRYLREKRLTIQETAYEMGFADSSTFHRAFKRWTGKTPGSYQDVHLEQPS
jgi:AraC-like DNA-binding protein